MSAPAIAIIGAGTLGRYIARIMASQGEDVRLFDLDADAAQATADAARSAAAGHVSATASLEDAVADAWLVIECIPEKLELKARLFGMLDGLCPPQVILASNSSSIPCSRFIGDVLHPERAVNLHFYNGSTAIEVMGHAGTDPAILDRLMQVLPGYGLVPFLVRRESVGFIYNRIWAAVKREALSVVAEGVASAAEVDAIHRLIEGSEAGPFLRMDRVGLDVVLDIEERYAAEFSGLPEGPRALLRDYVGQGRLGAKTGGGFHHD